MPQPYLQICKAEHHDHPNGIAIRFSNDSNVMIFPGRNFDCPCKYASIWNANDAGWYIEEFQKSAAVAEVDWSKPIQRRDGKHSPRLLATLAKAQDDLTVVIKDTNESQQEFVYCVHKNGRTNPYVEQSHDIINVPFPVRTSLKLDYEVAVARHPSHGIAFATRFDGSLRMHIASVDQNHHWYYEDGKEAMAYSWTFGDWQRDTVAG